MKTAQISDIGRIRVVNEDRCFIQNDLYGFTLAVVADGMGGHQAGDTASQLAIETIMEHLGNGHSGMPEDEYKILLKEAVLAANDKVYLTSRSRKDLEGMGTTIVLALASAEELMIAHIGDSRAYKFSNGSVIQLTEDHSLVNELVKKGQLTPDEADRHPNRNILTRALGTERQVSVDVLVEPWQERDLLLLCSDGLSSLVDTEQITHILMMDDPLEERARKLVNFALDEGGDDNITVVLLENSADDVQGG